MRAGYSLRSGGFSCAPWDSFNLGQHVGDRPECVGANRLRLADSLGVRPVFLRQVHGWGVQALPCADDTEADAVLADQAGSACCILVADCLPVLLSDDQGRVVAAAHAGWRGLSGQGGLGVIEALLDRLRQRLPRADWLAWLGPAIGPRAFEVDADVLQAFASADADAERHFHPLAGRAGKWYCDLPGLARDRLQAQGIDHILGNDGSDDWCTHSRADLFFSHRRDACSGRMAAAIFLDPHAEP